MDMINLVLLLENKTIWSILRRLKKGIVEEHRNRIEQHGDVLEHMGFMPVASRVFVYLLLSGSEGALFDDLITAISRLAKVPFPMH